MKQLNHTYVRLKKVDKPAGYMCRRYMYRGSLFKSGDWRRVPTVVAKELSQLIQPNSEKSPKPLFDIARDRHEAEEMDRVDIPATEVGGADLVDEANFRGLTAAVPDAPIAGSKLLEPAPLADDEAAPGDLVLDDDAASDESSDPAPAEAAAESAPEAAADPSGDGPKAQRGRARK